MGRTRSRDESIGEALQEAQASMRLSVKDFAALCGYGDKAMSAWMRAMRAPSPAARSLIVQKLAQHDAAVAQRLAGPLGVPMQAQVAAPSTASPAAARAVDPPARFDAAVLAAADAMGVPARALRGALAHVLLQARACGMTIDRAYEAVVPEGSRATR